MTAQTGIISLIVNELTEFEQQINSQPRGELKTQLMKLQVNISTQLGLFFPRTLGWTSTLFSNRLHPSANKEGEN